MMNRKYYSFERNNYYYGKLLTSKDFQNEQDYINNKRRLINRVLHGVGIVYGLDVVAAVTLPSFCSPVWPLMQREGRLWSQGRRC